MLYLLSILFRALSGVQNGFYYGKNMLGVSMTTMTLIFISFLTILVWDTPALATYTLAFSMGFCAWLYFVFLSKQGDKIHLVETLLTGSYTLAIAFLDIPTAILSVYPGLVLHKMGVNYLGGWPVFYEGTDDPKGKYYSIYIFGKQIKIPRTNFKIRFILAVLSIALYILYLLKSPLKFNIIDVFIWLKELL